MNQDAFKTYLEHLQTYQCLIQFGLIAGLILAVIGVGLIFFLKDYTKKENLHFNISDKITLNFSSTLSGSLVTLSGAAIVVCSLWTIRFIFPKINGDGWTVSSLLTENKLFPVHNVSSNSNKKPKLYELRTSNDSVVVRGYLLDKKMTANQLKSEDSLSIPINAIKTTEAMEDFETNGKVFFYPIMTKSNGLLNKSIRQEIEASASMPAQSIEIKKTEDAL